MLFSLIFIVVLMWGKIFFITAWLWRAEFSKAPIKEVTGCWGSELQMKFGSFRRFEEMETEMGICFPIHFVVSVPWSFLLARKLILSWKVEFKFLKSLCSLVYSIPKIHLVKQSFLGLIYVLRIDIFHSFTACSQILFQIGCSIEESLILRATKGLENCVNDSRVTFMVIVSQQSDSIPMCLHTQSSEFTNYNPLYNIDITEKNIE